MNIVHVVSSPVEKAAGVRESYMLLSYAQRESSTDLVSLVGLEHPDWVSQSVNWIGDKPYLFNVVGPRSFGYAPGMTKGIEALNPDIVHLHGLWMHPGRSVLQWANKSGKPYVVSVHGMLSDVALSYSRFKKKLVLDWFQREVLLRASAIHVTSYDEAEKVAKFGVGNKIVILPHGVRRLDFSIPKSLVKEKVVLSLGRIHKIKALEILVKSWSQLEQQFPDWRLLLVGPDQDGELARLKSLVSTLGLVNVHFKGPVFGQEKIDVMSRASIFALPSLSENFGITVAESLMLGVPVVCSKGAPWQGLDDRRCGRWVDIGVEPMTHALEDLMRLSSSELNEMGLRGRRWMQEDFSWESIAKAMRAEYQSILDRGTA